MEIGTPGAGAVAQAIARHVIKQGHSVTLSHSRGPESLLDLANELGPLATAGSASEAAQAEMLFFAGDDAEAKRTFAALFAGVGFAPVDVGGLRDGGRLMQIGGPLSALHALKQD